MSVRDVGDLLNVSFTTVSHMENGRATILDDYVKRFLKAHDFSIKTLKISWCWKLKEESLRPKCFRLVEKMGQSKLEKAYVVLSVLSVVFGLLVL